MFALRAAVLILLLASACLTPGATFAGPVLPGELLVAVGPVGDPDGTDPEAPPYEPAVLFVVDPVTGDRRILSGRGIGAGPEFNEAGDVTVSSDGIIYVTDEFTIPSVGERGAIFRVDPVTGNRTIVSGLGVGSGPELLNGPGNLISALVEENGDILVVRTGDTITGQPPAVFRVNPESGSRTIISGLGIGAGPPLDGSGGIVRLSDGTIVIEDSNSASVANELVRIQPATGDRASVVPEVLIRSANDLALNDDGEVLAYDFLDLALYSLDPNSGSATLLSKPGVIGTGPELQLFNFALNSEGQVAAAAFNLENFLGDPVVAYVDIATGDRTILSGPGLGNGPDFPASFKGLAVYQVPEPPTFALFLFGILLYAMRRSRHSLLK